MLGRAGPAPAGRRGTPSGPGRRGPGGWTGRVGIFGRWSFRPGRGVCGAPGIVTGRLCCLEGACPPGPGWWRGNGRSRARGRANRSLDGIVPARSGRRLSAGWRPWGAEWTAPPHRQSRRDDLGRPGTRSKSGRATSGPVGSTRGMSGFSKSLSTRSVVRAAPSGFGFATCWGVSAAANGAGAGVGGGDGRLDRRCLHWRGERAADRGAERPARSAPSGAPGTHCDQWPHECRVCPCVSRSGGARRRPRSPAHRQLEFGLLRVGLLFLKSLESVANPVCRGAIQRAGMGPDVLNTELRQYGDDLAGLDFQFPC